MVWRLPPGRGAHPAGLAAERTVNPRTYRVDRVLAFLTGLLLLLGGVWVVVWAADLLPAGWWSPPSLRLRVSDAYVDDPWWPWALINLGLVLTAVGVAWFASHFRRHRVARLSLPGDAEGGRLLLDGSALGSGAAAALVGGSQAVTGADGKLLDQGQRIVLDLHATIRPDADLAEVNRICDAVVEHAVRSSGRSDLRSRVRLTVAARSRPAPRVH